MQTIYAQPLVRQESSNQLKKVVYSGKASLLPQVVVGGHPYAVFPIPEINLTNMPSVTVWVDPTVLYNDRPRGWMPADYDYLDNENVILSNGICYLDWVGVFTNFQIIIVYEDNSAVQQLSATNSIRATFGNSGTIGNTGTEINLNFATQPKVFYYIQASQNLTTWTNYDGPFLGSGEVFLKAYPTTNQSKQFFRFSATSLESW